jgi:site-specific recombinase XerD
MILREFFIGLLQFKGQFGMCAKTIQEYQRLFTGVLSSAVGDIDHTKIKLTDVGKIMEAGRAHGEYGPQRGIVVFRQLLQYIKAAGFAIPIDWRDIRVPAPPKRDVEWLDKDEFSLVRNSFDLNTIRGLRDRALVENLRVSGMRISEALSLNRDDIDWKRKQAKIMNAKTKEWELVYFSEESLAWLKRYLDMRNDKFPPVFTTSNGTRLLPCTARNCLHQATKDLGLKKRVHPHIFRSTFGTELLQGGVDIKSVQHLMRHKSERTTLKHYIAYSKTRCKGEHERIMDGHKFQNPAVLTDGLAKIRAGLGIDNRLKQLA